MKCYREMEKCEYDMLLGTLKKELLLSFNFWLLTVSSPGTVPVISFSHHQAVVMFCRGISTSYHAEHHVP